MRIPKDFAYYLLHFASFYIIQFLNNDRWKDTVAASFEKD